MAAVGWGGYSWSVTTLSTAARGMFFHSSRNTPENSHIMSQGFPLRCLFSEDLVGWKEWVIQCSLLTLYCAVPGYREYGRAEGGAVNGLGNWGYCWSCTWHDTHRYLLWFYMNDLRPEASDLRCFGYQLRCLFSENLLPFRWKDRGCPVRLDNPSCASAAGYRNPGGGTSDGGGKYGYSWSHTYTGTQGIHLYFYEGGLQSDGPQSLAFGFELRCLTASV